MSSDSRHTAEEALLSALQRRLNEPGAEYRTAEAVSPQAVSLLVEARNYLLSPRDAANGRDLATQEADPSAWEFDSEIRLAPPVPRELNDPVLVAEADRAAVLLNSMSELERYSSGTGLNSRAEERLYAAFLNLLVLDLVDLEAEFNLTPNQAWMLYLGTLGDAAEGHFRPTSEWHRDMADRIGLVIHHELQHPLAHMPFEDRSLSGDVALLKLDKHYDDRAWLHLHALLDALARRSVAADGPLALLHEAWNDHEFLLAVTPVDTGALQEVEGPAPLGWLTNAMRVEGMRLADALNTTAAELGRYVQSSDALFLGGRAVIANGDLTDWFQMPGKPSVSPASPSLSFGQLRAESPDAASSGSTNVAQDEPDSRPGGVLRSDASKSPQHDPVREVPFAASLDEAVERRDGGPGSTFRADDSIAYVQARSVLGKGSRLKVKQVAVDEKDGSVLLLTVVVEKDVPKSREPVLDLLGHRQQVELANWSGWRATLTPPTDRQNGLQDSNSESPRRTTVLWEGTMELDPLADLSPRTVTERLEDLLRRLLGEGFQPHAS